MNYDILDDITWSLLVKLMTNRGSSRQMSTSGGGGNQVRMIETMDRGQKTIVSIVYIYMVYMVCI